MTTTSRLKDNLRKWLGIAVDAILNAVNFITEKTGEGVKIARLYREKTKIEDDITSQLAELGKTVHGKISKERLDDISKQLELQDKLKHISQTQTKLQEVNKKIEEEQKERRAKAVIKSAEKAKQAAADKPGKKAKDSAKEKVEV